jgi:hypothetical protein
MVRFVEIVENPYANDTSSKRYTLRETFINPDHVIMVREDASIASNITEQNSHGIDPRHSYSKILINRGTTGQETIVVGTPQQVYEKLNSSQKTLLKG